jgi:hypothetical protein
VRVPKEAALGTAKLRLSYAAWKDGGVAATTVEVPVVAEGAVGNALRGVPER